MAKKENHTIKLELRRKSWANLFHVLHELGLSKQHNNRPAIYHKQFGTHFSEGNFWACVQYLEQQFEEQTGLRTQRDYVQEILCHK